MCLHLNFVSIFTCPSLKGQIRPEPYRMTWDPEHPIPDPQGPQLCVTYCSCHVYPKYVGSQQQTAGWLIEYRSIRSWSEGIIFLRIRRLLVLSPTVLRNRNYLLRFRSRLLTSNVSGSGSGSLDSFYLEKIIYKLHQIYCKMWMKSMLNEGNQKQFVCENFCDSILRWFWFWFWFRFRFRYGKKLQSLPMVPVPQHWSPT
jgi:hypothetical protein